MTCELPSCPYFLLPLFISLAEGTSIDLCEPALFLVSFAYLPSLRVDYLWFGSYKGGLSAGVPLLS